MRTVSTTKVKAVIEYNLRDLFATYGTPERIVNDQGTIFTSTRQFKMFRNQNSIDHIGVAVATPRANGQVERTNQSMFQRLLTLASEDNRWDDHLRDVQFAINNTVKSLERTPS